MQRINFIRWRLLPLIDRFKQIKDVDKKDIWLYTGYLYEDILKLDDNDPRKILLFNINILVDGRFILEKKDIRLKFRGSSNQRIIDVQKSIKEGTIQLFKV